MSAIVSGVLKLTFGFMAQKIRSNIATRLKDGDVTNEECWRLIVRELDDIKSKLDGLARKDLLSSLCFLQEGINRLFKSLLRSDSIENLAESTEQAASTTAEVSSTRDSGLNSPVNESIALINAMTSLKICSNVRYKSAMESFKLAREKATEAFCNEALSKEDRIQASQIRIMARILESLEDPDASVSDCLGYLKQLHDMGRTREIFSVLIGGGIKSRFKKTKRLNNASAVQDMNVILFEFAKKFTKSSLLEQMFHWPTICLGDERYHPLFPDIHHDVEESGLQAMSLWSDFTFDDEINPECSVVNSNGEIIGQTSDNDTFRIFSQLPGEIRNLCEGTKRVHDGAHHVCTIGIDVEDNIYVIMQFNEAESSASCSFMLGIITDNKKLEYPLPFQLKSSTGVCIAINKDGKIAILDSENSMLCFANVSIDMNSFKVEKIISLRQPWLEGDPSSIKIVPSYFNGTKVMDAFILYDENTVYIVTESGDLQRKITIPKEHAGVESIVINHTRQRILVQTRTQSYYSLLSFSENGQLMDNLLLASRELNPIACLVSHPNGPVALVNRKGAVLLQL